MPLTNNRVLAPDSNGRSSTIGVSNSETSSSAGTNLIRSRPGSPWMPTPSSISSSASVNEGSPECGTVHGVSATPIDLTCELTRSAIAVTAARSSPRAADATPPSGPRRILDGDVVGHHDGGDLDVLGGGQLSGDLEVEHVTGVVLH